MIIWRDLVRYPETFTQHEQSLLDQVPSRIIQVLVGAVKPETKEEKNIYVNCTKSLPTTESQKALRKFHIQTLAKKSTASGIPAPQKTDYDKLASGSSHGNRTKRLEEQKKDRWGNPC